MVSDPNPISPEIQSQLLSSFEGSAWKKIKMRRHHGVNIPLFSLHTKESGGIGEFLDLKPVIDWCQKVGFDIIQILPINDTGPEPSPYSSISAFALNPLHISLAQLEDIHQHEDLINLLTDLQALNKTQRIDYPQLHQKREEFLHLYYQYTYAKVSQTDDYRSFLFHNSWTKEYALFKALKIIRQWQPWDQWPQELRAHCPTDLDRLYEEYNTQISYHTYLQYLCFKQFEMVKSYAKEKKVFLKGDIPILISHESEDVWLDHNIFLLDYTAGAPADMFSKEGQNWQFPIYNWDEIEKNNYSWWRERLEVASRLYDLFRIDHIVGFFRIWAIPLGKKGMDGKFLPEDPQQWIEFGKKNLMRMLQNCPMLPIGEDLGVVPPEVKACLKYLGICGTKVMRWERNWDGDKSFIDIHQYPIESMTTVSTHDSETLNQWWRDQPEEASAYAASKGWNYAPLLTREQNIEILKDSHRSNSIFHINLLNEYLALIPEVTWPELADERINNPGEQTSKNWSYRFRPSFEEIAENKELEELIKSLIEK